MGLKLFNKDTGKVIGAITAEQLQQLKDLLEEEDTQDHDYYIDRDLLEYLQDEGADPAVLELLRKEITDEEGVEIEWREEA
jgi:hypothetical protein